MFAPHAAKSNAKSAAPSQSSSPVHGATPCGTRDSGADRAARPPQPIGRQADLRKESKTGTAGQETGPENLAATGGSRGPAWDVRKIPVFPSEVRSSEFTSPSQLPPPRPVLLQTKLKVGAVDDALEHEADRIAEQVTRVPSTEGALPSPAPPNSRKREREEEGALHVREATAGAAGGEAPASVYAVLRSPGQPLDLATRDMMEQRFGRDLSDVRVHADAAAAQSAREVSAHAYAVGPNIVFGAGEFAPATRMGQKLLAHELTHVVQQASAGGMRPFSPANGHLLLQRSPFGLAAKGKPTEFGETSARWAKKYPKTTLEDYATILLEEANARLEKIGVPSVDPGPGPDGSVARFVSTSWTIGIDLAKAGGHPATAPVDVLTPEELTEVSVSLYHEARHAEQRFLEARLAVGKDKNKDAKAIAAEIFIPERVAAAAIAAGGKLTPGQATLAGNLTEFRDKYTPYKMWIKRVSAPALKIVEALPRPSPQGVDAITKAWAQVQPNLATWGAEVTWADTQIDTIAKLKKRDSVDEQVLKDLRLTRKMLQTALDKATAMQAVVTDWANLQKTTEITVELTERARHTFVLSWLELTLALSDVALTGEASYESYPEEADTRSTENEIRKTVLQLAPAAKPGP